jgi:hypothetical protein
MKPLVLAAAIVALSAPVALAQNAAKRPVADAAQAQSDVPDTVKTYVRSHAGDPFPYSGGEIKVGGTVRDAGDVWRPIPDHPEYLWSNLAGQLVVIDKQTSKVVALY